MQNKPERSIAVWALACRLIDMSMDGGSSDTGITADAARPAGNPSNGSRVLINATAPGILRSALFRFVTSS